MTALRGVRHHVRMAMRINLLLPEDLVAEVDHFAGSRGRSRYVAEALRARVRRDRLREVAEQTFGAWKAAGGPVEASDDARKS